MKEGNKWKKELLKFPNGFLWGVTAASEQSDGYKKGQLKRKTGWDIMKETKPEKFFNGETVEKLICLLNIEKMI
ncbi:MAG: hypothetical protein K4H23_04370 [Mollicutes bacterium PWAP]|nr:hypothetical protein [Mollicutes bacterium PWAP]